MTPPTAPALPPADLAKRSPARESIVGTWYRVAHQRYHKTVHFFSDAITNRFGSPTAPFGVSYYGKTPMAAFAETIRGGMIYAGNTLKEVEMKPLELHTVEISEIKQEPLNEAFSTFGAGARRIGAQADCFNLGTAVGYACSQAWAVELMAHPEEAAGILYYGNQSVERCLGLFGEKQSKGVSGRRAKGLKLEITESCKVLESADFLEWLNESRLSVVARVKP